LLVKVCQFFFLSKYHFFVHLNFFTAYFLSGDLPIYWVHTDLIKKNKRRYFFIAHVPLCNLNMQFLNQI